MKRASLEFLDLPKTTLQQIQKERIDDWHEDGKHLGDLMKKYEEDYRIKICSKCIGTQQQIDRKCYNHTEKNGKYYLEKYGKLPLDSNGNDLTNCNHLVKAQYNKFRDKIFTHIDFHPMFFNPK